MSIKVKGHYSREASTYCILLASIAIIAALNLASYLSTQDPFRTFSG